MNQPSLQEQIFDAVKKCDVSKIQSILQSDASMLNVTDCNQITPLTIAFAYGHLNLAQSLIQQGANVFAMNHSDKWGMRYITEFAGLSQDDRQRFVETAIEADAWDDEVFQAVWRRDTQQLQSILTKQPERASTRLAKPDGKNGFYNALPYCGLTPLHYAVIAGDEPTVRVLLDAGAEVDAIPHDHKPDSRHTPLYFVPQGCESIAELLIERGADVNHTNQYLTGGSESMRKVIVANGAGGTPLMAALTIGDIEQAANIIRDDPSVINDRLPDSRVDTPLHMAVKAGSQEIVKQLLDAGMEIDTPTSRGFTALALAPEMYCSLEMIQFLVESGADVRTGTDSPIHAAVWQHAYRHWDYESVIRYLAGQGSQPRGLCNCVQAGNLAAVKLLIELGADVNETDEMGFYVRHPKATGHNALDYSTGVVGEQKYPEIEAILREHGAK